MKKVVGVAAGALAIVATTTPVFAQQNPFPDVPADHWAAQAVKVLQNRGIVIGYPDGTYGGPRAMTRYEFAMAISRLILDTTREINEAIAKIPQIDTSKFALKTDIPDVSDFVRKEDLPDFTTFVKRDELNNYYTKPEVDTRLADINNKIGALQAVMDQFRDQ
ncbi:MAG: S-layer homology domain-containing protein, partial [Armatimonadota bacterium]|nr:S-layer homology domain-containing protein [Armatimonadota bacterium]